MPQPLTLSIAPWTATLRGIFFPPVCLICDRSMGLSTLETVCGGCADALKPGRASAPEEASARELDDIHALYHYGSAARRLIHRIKLTRDPRAGRWLASELERRPAFGAARYDLIVPVPSHRKSSWFGSAAEPGRLWADALSARFGVPVAEGLRRSRTVAKQTALRRDSRLAASANSLVARGAAIGGCRSVLLTDDVLTTGATARACAGLLKSRGVERVAVAVIARG